MTLYSWDEIMAQQAAREKTLSYKLKRRYVWPIRRKWSYLRRTPRRIKYYHQRGKRGWSDEDWWGLDTYLARVMVESLTHFRDNMHGFPGRGDAKYFEDWEKILDDIIYGFERYLEVNAWEDGNEYWKMRRDLSRSFNLLKTWFPHLWD